MSIELQIRQEAAARLSEEFGVPVRAFDDPVEYAQEMAVMLASSLMSKGLEKIGLTAEQVLNAARVSMQAVKDFKGGNTGAGIASISQAVLNAYIKGLKGRGEKKWKASIDNRVASLDRFAKAAVAREKAGRAWSPVDIPRFKFWYRKPLQEWQYFERSGMAIFPDYPLGPAVITKDNHFMFPTACPQAGAEPFGTGLPWGDGSCKGVVTAVPSLWPFWRNGAAGFSGGIVGDSPGFADTFAARREAVLSDPYENLTVDIAQVRRAMQVYRAAVVNAGNSSLVYMRDGSSTGIDPQEMRGTGNRFFWQSGRIFPYFREEDLKEASVKLSGSTAKRASQMLSHASPLAFNQFCDVVQATLEARVYLVDFLEKGRPINAIQASQLSQTIGGLKPARGPAKGPARPSGSGGARVGSSAGVVLAGGAALGLVYLASKGKR